MLLAAALVASAAILLAHRFYRMQVVSGFVPLMCWIVTVALLVHAAKTGRWRTWTWFVPAAVLALEMVPLVPLMMLLAIFGSSDGKVVVVGVSPDGRYEAVTHDVNAVIDTLCGVRLRERDGLFSRQTRVWTAAEGQRCPRRVSFTETNTISIIDARGREITAHFDPDRLEVAQVLEPPS